MPDLGSMEFGRDESASTIFLGASDWMPATGAGMTDVLRKIAPL